MSDEIARQIIPINVEDEMRSSYVDYAMSVIIGRALPDVRDGLKPVHRRVLFTMHESRNFHNQAYKKSARIVGDVMGKYHPHGDSAIYDTIVRMAQDFNMRYLLVDGQGNFGSVDGDAAAAMRYTEVRMKCLAEEMLTDIEKDTVDMLPNYDGSLKEPAVLPTRVPNLLVNGSSGIAVGMSTNIPPHNLGEVVDATVALIRKPDITIAELMQFLPGPDFPTGGFIQGTAGIRAAYETGRGAIKMKAKADIEVDKRNDRPAIVVTEIPYQVNKAKLIERIAELHKDKRVEGIHDMRDESDRDGMRIVVDLKKDADPQVLLNQLFSLTALQTSFNVINLSIVDGQPRVLNLKQTLEEFIRHRKNVVTRRCIFELSKALDREHILLGYQIGLANLDEVIELIKQSKTPEEARDALCRRFELSERQAKAILELRLERLTRMEAQKILDELEEIRRFIARMREILGSEAVLMDVIVEELREIREGYADTRRTQITEDEGEISLEDLIPEEDVVVTQTAEGFIKRTPVAQYRAQRRGGKGKLGMVTRDEDNVVNMFVASTHTHILIFTSRGRVFRVRVFDVPQGSRTGKGRAIVNFLNLSGQETVQAVLPVKDFSLSQSIMFATRQGLVKRTELALFRNIRSNGILAIKLDPDDDLISVRLASSEDNVLLFTTQGKSIRFLVSDVRAIGRDTRGVRGMHLKAKDTVVGMEIVKPGCQILAVTERGYGRRTDAEEYRLQRRGGTGVLAMRANKKVGFVVGMRSVTDDDEVILNSAQGTMIRIRTADIPLIGRVTQGVRLMNLDPSERLVAIDILVDAEEGAASVEDGGDDASVTLPAPEVDDTVE